MSTTEERLSWAAIILSAAAFTISVSQALQQYLATAEGFRRCQKKVLGPWTHNFTRRKLRLKELRFETIYGTPLISLTPLFDQHQCFSLPDSHSLVSHEDDLVPKENEFKSSSNANWVCWLRLLEELKALHIGLLSSLPKDRVRIGEKGRPSIPHELEELEDGSKFCFNVPSFIPEVRSWDFVPADVLKPLAVIGISDLAICMRRMGLKWIQFQPMDAMLRAEGNNLSLTSSYLRAVGCVVTYTRVGGKSGQSRFPLKGALIPCVQADAMGFGLLPSCHSNAGPFFNVSTVSSILDAFESFQPSEKALQRLRDLFRSDNFFYAFTDLIPLTVPFMRRKSSPLVRIPAPMDRPVWLFHSNTGRTAFRYLLRKELEQKKGKYPNQPGLLQGLSALLAAYESLIIDYPHLNNANKDHRVAMESNGEKVELLDRVQGEFDKIQHYFANKAKEMCELQTPLTSTRVDSSIEDARSASEIQFGGSNLYSDLVTVHLRNAVLADKYAELKLKDPDSREPRYEYPLDMKRPPKWNNRMAEALGQYTYRWEFMKKELEELGWVIGGEVQFLEMWAHMMMRGFYWQFCHCMIEGPRVPAEFWNSKMPVYIG